MNEVSKLLLECEILEDMITITEDIDIFVEFPHLYTTCIGRILSIEEDGFYCVEGYTDSHVDCEKVECELHFNEFIKDDELESKFYFLKETYEGSR